MRRRRKIPKVDGEGVRKILLMMEDIQNMGVKDSLCTISAFSIRAFSTIRTL